MIISFLHRFRLVAVAIVVALLAAACGGSDEQVEQDPSQALSDAFEALADYEGFELRIRLEADDAALAQAMAEGELTEDVAGLINDSSLLVRATGEGDDGAAEFVLTIGGDDLLEFRVLPVMEVYARIDLNGLLALADDPELDVDALLADAEAFGLGAAAAALAEGSWIHLAGLEQLMAMAEGMAGVEQEELDEAEVEALAEEIAAAAQRFLDEGVEVTFVGSEDAGERVRVTADGAALADFLADVVDIVADFGDAAGDMGMDLGGEIRQEIPAGASFSLDAWISDGRLSQVALDLAAVPDADIDGELLLILEIREFTGSIDAPSGATEIDLFSLLGGFMGGGFGFPGDDPFGDEFDFEGDADFDEDFDFDEDGFEGAPECITLEDLDELEQFMGEEARQEFEALIDAGFLELC